MDVIWKYVWFRDSVDSRSAVAKAGKLTERVLTHGAFQLEEEKFVRTLGEEFLHSSYALDLISPIGTQISRLNGSSNLSKRILALVMDNSYANDELDSFHALLELAAQGLDSNRLQEDGRSMFSWAVMERYKDIVKSVLRHEDSETQVTTGSRSGTGYDWDRILLIISGKVSSGGGSIDSLAS